jgi:hypothetical protein
LLNHSTDIPSKNNGFHNNGFESKPCNKNGIESKTFNKNRCDDKTTNKSESDKDILDKNEMDKNGIDKNELKKTKSNTLPQGLIHQSKKVLSNFNSSQSFDQLSLEREKVTKDVGGLVQ